MYLSQLSGELHHDYISLDLRCIWASCQVSCIMITYPSTYGVFEPAVRWVASWLHIPRLTVYSSQLSGELHHDYIFPRLTVYSSQLSGELHHDHISLDLRSIRASCQVSCIMITYPSTYGLFEPAVRWVSWMWTLKPRVRVKMMQRSVTTLRTLLKKVVLCQGAVRDNS